MLITDSNDNKEGKLIQNGTEISYDQNPDAVYVFEGPISNPNDKNVVEELGGGANIYSLHFPSDGEYTIQLSSNENTFYTLNASTFQEDGTHKLHKIEGSIKPAHIKEFTLNFSNNSESSIKEIVNFKNIYSDLMLLYKNRDIKRYWLYRNLRFKFRVVERVRNEKIKSFFIRSIKHQIDRRRGKGLTENAYQVINANLNSIKNNL